MVAAILAPVADGPPGSEVSTSFTAAATAFGWSSGVKCRPPGIRSSPAEDVVADAWFEAVVAEALAALPAVHRIVVQLVDVDGLSYAEAAHALGVPRGTVISRPHRARARIRTRLVAAGLVPHRSRP